MDKCGIFGWMCWLWINVPFVGFDIFGQMCHLGANVHFRRVLLVCHKNKWHDLSQKFATSLFLFIEEGQEIILIGQKYLWTNVTFLGKMQLTLHMTISYNRILHVSLNFFAKNRQQILQARKAGAPILPDFPTELHRVLLVTQSLSRRLKKIRLRPKA